MLRLGSHHNQGVPPACAEDTPFMRGAWRDMVFEPKYEFPPIAIGKPRKDIFTIETRSFTAEDAERFKAQRRALDTRWNEDDISSVEFFCDEMDALAQAGIELSFLTSNGDEEITIITDSLSAIPGINVSKLEAVRLPAGANKVFATNSTTFILGNAQLDMQARRPRKRVGTLLTGFNFLKATSDNPIVFSGSFDSMVVKTDTPLTSGEFRDSIIDSTGSDFSGVTGMFATLISGTIRTSGSFFLETIGIVGEVALDAVAGDSTSFVDARNGFITSEGTKWVDIAEKATGESNMDAWSVDMMGVLRAQIEEGEAPQFNTFCVNPANDAANCDCATWLFFRDAGSADARQVWVWRNAQIGNAVDPAVMEGMDVAAVEHIWRDTMAGIWTD